MAPDAEGTFEPLWEARNAPAGPVYPLTHLAQLMVKDDASRVHSP